MCSHGVGHLVTCVFTNDCWLPEREEGARTSGLSSRQGKELLSKHLPSFRNVHDTEEKVSVYLKADSAGSAETTPFFSHGPRVLVVPVVECIIIILILIT